MLSHIGTITIKTNRLVLRSFIIGDTSSMFYNWAGDRDVCQYMAWPQRKSLEETQNIIEKVIKAYTKPSYYQWNVTLKENNESIGIAGLSIVDEGYLCGGVSYCIGKNYWGKGIATEVLKAVLDFAFNEVGFNRIEAYHSINNPSSGRVMEKAGMTFEGMARQKYKSNLGFEDSNMYGILKEDFKVLNKSING